MTKMDPETREVVDYDRYNFMSATSDMDFAYLGALLSREAVRCKAIH